ncbi:MAG TPA: hypothetical protein VF702_03440 [Allosphingosinicella sp.]|jgi:hypothetical protein
MTFEAGDLALALCMMIGAALYPAVGHAGASAYIAPMTLFGVPREVMRPAALLLPLYAGAVLVRGAVGTTLGIRLALPIILKALGVVLLVASAKLVGVY